MCIEEIAIWKSFILVYYAQPKLFNQKNDAFSPDTQQFDYKRFEREKKKIIKWVKRNFD